jgi:predicted MFS family arabinose efflux permease
MVVRTVMNTMYRLVYPFLADLGRGLGVDLQTLSVLMTARSVAGALGPLLASLADIRGRKAGVLFGLLLFNAGVAAVVIWPTFIGFVLAVMLTAIAKYTFDPAMQAFLGDRVPYERRGLAVAVTELSWSLSFILGIPLVGLLITRSGWAGPFPLLLILGVLSMLVMAWLLPDDSLTRINNIHTVSFFRNLQLVVNHPPAQAALILGLLVTMANEVINLVFGVWLEDSFGLQIMALGAASAVIGFSELGGESLVGALNDRLGKERSIAYGLILNSLAVLALPVIGSGVPGALTGLFMFYLTFEFTLVSIIPMMTELFPSARATLMAVNIASLSLGRAIGALLASPLYQTGFQANAFAALGLNILAFLSLIALVRAKKTYS